MRLLDGDLWLSRMPDPPAASALPFTFLPQYAQHLRAWSGHRHAILADEERGIYLPLRLWRNRLIGLAQMLFPPLQGPDRLAPEQETVFLKEALAFLAATGSVDRLVQPPNFALFQAAPEDSRSCAFGSYVVRLEGRSEDELLGRLHPHHRRGIRKAADAGTAVRYGREQLPTFQAMHAGTMGRSELPATSLAELDSLYGALGDQHVTCAVAYSPAGEPQGGACLVHTTYAAYYLCGASPEAPEIPGAVKLVHWELIRRCHQSGVRYYDFVGARLRSVTGSKLEHIQRFKEFFGSDLVRGVLWKADLHPYRTAVYDVADAVRRTFRTAAQGASPRMRDIIDQEHAWHEAKARNGPAA